MTAAHINGAVLDQLHEDPALWHLQSYEEIDATVSLLRQEEGNLWRALADLIDAADPYRKTDPSNALIRAMAKAREAIRRAPVVGE